MWYATFPGRQPVPIGVYDHPPDEAGVKSLRLNANGMPYYYGTAVRELTMYTRWRDRVSDWLASVL